MLCECREPCAHARKLLPRFEEFGKQESKGLQIAEKLKKHFDEEYGPYWHVTVGKNFGCHAVHEKQRFIYFYIDPFAFLIYKAQ